MLRHWGQIEHKYPPRENQKIGISNAVDGFTTDGFHGLLMEMSLGKTKTTLNAAEILHKYGALKRMVVICPKVIQSVWLTDEIPKHAAWIESPVIWENKQTKKLQRQVYEMLEADFGVIIVRLELFQKKNAFLKNFLEEFFKEPTLIVLDESSKIKNVATQRTPRLIEYTRKAKYKTILTGTPWTESPLDIFSQMEFMQTGFWYKYSGEWAPATLKKHWYIFRNRYAIMQDIRMGEGRSFKTIVGTRRTEEIARKIQTYVTQQKKEDWQDLPEKIFQPLHVEMHKEQREAYKTMKDTLILEYGDEILTAGSAVTLLTRLRQIAGGFFPETGEIIGKCAGIEMLLEDVSEYSGKVLVSCAYVAEVNGIVKALRKVYGDEKVEPFYGATKDRDEVKRRFKEEGIKFLVGTEQVMSYGHNWQFCSLMYRYSMAFSYERNKQLVDRIHRPGMIGAAVYKDVIHTGTVQEKVLKAFEKKEDVVKEFDKLTLKDFLN